MHWRAGFNCAVAKSSTGYLTYILKILRSNIVPIAYCIDEPIAIIRFWMQAIQDRKKIDDRKIYESSKCLSSLNWNYFFCLHRIFAIKIFIERFRSNVKKVQNPDNINLVQAYL